MIKFVLVIKGYILMCVTCEQLCLCYLLQCHDVFGLITTNVTNICNFIINTEDCQIEDGLVNYTLFAFCPFQWVHFIWKLILLVSKLSISIEIIS